MSEAAKISTFYIPVTREFLVESLWWRTRDMRPIDRAVEYLHLGQAVDIGEQSFNPSHIAEGIEFVVWDHEDYVPYLDWWVEGVVYEC